MMDFDSAVRRVNRENGAIRARNKDKQREKQRVQRLKALNKKKEEERRRAREEKQMKEARMKSVLTHSEQELRLVSLGKSRDEPDLKLRPVSIHGDGDKITLPASILELLMQRYNNDLSGISPLMFRIGVLNPNYAGFPASQSIRDWAERSKDKNEETMDVDEGSDEEEDKLRREMYDEEMKLKYLSYTYATVIEFSQEEGFIGIPSIVSKSLCKSSSVPVMRTIDPANVRNEVGNNNEEQAANMDDDDKTPGHIAWGLFDVPSVDIEVTMVSLPKATSCTLVPSTEAIHKGFYNLKDVKVTLEKSIILTRGTLVVGDLIYTWHRGTAFGLRIGEVFPSNFNAVSCINTDVEINFGEISAEETNVCSGDNSKSLPLSANAGKKLSSTASSSNVDGSQTYEERRNGQENELIHKFSRNLLEEPPKEQKQNVCKVIVKSSNGVKERRFDVSTATISDLYAFASSVTDQQRPFRLATQYPRRIIECQDTNKDLLLSEAGIQPESQIRELSSIRGCDSGSVTNLDFSSLCSDKKTDEDWCVSFESPPVYLRSLVLSSNSILDASSLLWIKTLKNLKAIDLSRNNLKSIPSQALGELVCLTSLQLEGNQIEDVEEIKNLRKNKHLKYLSFQNFEKSLFNPLCQNIRYHSLIDEHLSSVLLLDYEVRKFTKAAKLTRCPNSAMADPQYCEELPRESWLDENDISNSIIKSNEEIKNIIQSIDTLSFDEKIEKSSNLLDDVLANSAASLQKVRRVTNMNFKI